MCGEMARISENLGAVGKPRTMDILGNPEGVPTKDS